MVHFASSALTNLFIAFGVILGASLFAGLAALITNHPPLKTMVDIAASLKIWAIAIALGGTFSSLEIIEKGVFNGEIRSIVKQVLFILVAVAGANLGYGFIRLLQICGQYLW